MQDNDPAETAEWLEALNDVLAQEGGPERATYLLKSMAEKVAQSGSQVPSAITTPFRNTIKPVDERRMPGDLFMERKIRSLIRWNALAMVMRANDNDEGLGGHISTFSSAATLYDIGFNYFFKGNDSGPGDLIYYQGHSAPGMYARSFLEQRLTEGQLDNFRREVGGNGLSSYPHPWLMPEYWQFPTVSMGLGPIQAIYQAHIMKYQQSRDLVQHGDRKVWAFLGDGECDEPESLGAIAKAGREHLDNLIFVVNCNLQRLDGPVRGNGKIIQELEGVFRGAGWNVIKVIWGRHWDALLEKDKTGLLKKRMNEVCDGELQNYKANGGAYTREHFFGKYPELLALVSDLSDNDIMYLNRGGHDPYKVYAAYDQAVNHNNNRPTVILAMTVKGYGMGDSGEAQNETHSLKKLDIESLKKFRDRFAIPVSDEELKDVPYYRPAQDSPEMVYMRKRRAELGGYIPSRTPDFTSLEVPQLEDLTSQLKSSGKRKISTTMSFVRTLSILTKDKKLGKRVVPIVPDEARTFGMEGMFRQLGIYSSQGQRYTPHDADQIMYYKEDQKGQILEEGINEAGAFSAWLAAATSYSNHGYPMVPFYVFYSMFGFQRIMDLAWAAGDTQARGFLMGATAGRTTLNGEGLQHQDGHSLLMANMIPNCVAYDPTYAYELTVIIQNGLKRMYQDKENCFYYITIENENYHHPEMPAGCEEGIIKGMYLLQKAENKKSHTVQLMGSGSILREVEEAATILRNDFDIDADIWSMTSINELRRDGMECDRWNVMNPDRVPKQSYIAEQLQGHDGPVICATDYMKSYGEQIAPFIRRQFRVLGTDGFGRSDTRTKLRYHFEVDRYFIVLAALKSLVDEGKLNVSVVVKAAKDFGISGDKPDPMNS